VRPRRRLRTVAVAALTAVAAALTLVGVTGVYGHAVLANNDRFADRLTETLRDENVRGAMARRLTDRIQSAKPDLVAVRPFIAAAAGAVVASSPFQSALHAAGTDLHASMFDRDRRSTTVTVTGAGLLVVHTLRRTHPDVAKRVPSFVESALTGLATVHESGSEIARRVEHAGRYGLAALLVAAMAALAAVLLAVDRKRALAALGLTLAATGAVGVIATAIARRSVLGSIPDGQNREATAAVWHVFAGGLHVWALATIAVGLIIAAAATASRGPRRRFRRERRARPAWVLLAGAALLAGTLVVARAAATPSPPRYTGEGCNGHRVLCDRRLDEVAFASTHNSMAAGSEPGWLFSQQEKGIGAQLRAGIRGLLIDTHYGVRTARGVKTDLEAEGTTRAKLIAEVGEPFVRAAERLRGRIGFRGGGAPEVFLCHGACEVGATPIVPALEEIRDFVVEHPREVIVISIEDKVTPADTVEAFRRSGLLPFVYEGAARPPWPTLEALIDSGRRVVVFGENKTGHVPWYHPQFRSVQETPFGFRSVAAMRPPGSCRPNRGPADAPLFLLNHWIDTPPANRPSNAKIVNTYDTLLARARACQRRRHRLPNLVAVDFYRTGDVVRVVDTLNGVR
jgi:hypothetical protein